MQLLGIKYILSTGNIRADRLQGSISFLLQIAVSTPSDVPTSEIAKTRVQLVAKKSKCKKHRHTTKPLQGFETLEPGH